ncbi:hypothetical protein BH11PSE3_BH11PSE3_34230 [soil metagenome]
MERVPYIDVREGGPRLHATLRHEQGLALRAACLGWLPIGGLIARLADPVARLWLRRSGSPLIADVAAIAGILGRPGIWLLHCAYAVGCTALADESADGPVLRRTLDWPFPGLGRLVEIARQRGPAGEFMNVTWPGFAGVLTAVAPGRFAASINQAPMRRRTSSDWLLWLDYALNALGALLISGRPPPEHLLRLVFETCATFEEACRFLERTPVARPVLFLVIGCLPGERLLIERDGDAARLYRDDTVVANAWHQEAPGWRPRVCGDGTPVENNRRRVAAMAAWADAHPPSLRWAVPPVVNGCTRVAIEMCAASGRLVVAGWEADGRVTAVKEVQLL